MKGIVTVIGLCIDIQLPGFYHRCTLHSKTQVCFVAPTLPATAVRTKGRHLIKQDLIQRVVERTGLVRAKAESAVDAIFESMKQSLAEGDRIELRGFGVFTVKPRKTGVGRNPRTGAEVSIAPGKAIRFKPGKELQEIE